jgi:uncharacterized membrane protein YsdA (DUF1294 family)
MAAPPVIWAAALLYGAGINLAAFLGFAWDKHCARRGLWRVPESRLLGLALLGGSLGAIAGQQVMRHKTRKEPFRTWLRRIAGAQALGLAALACAGVAWQAAARLLPP